MHQNDRAQPIQEDRVSSLYAKINSAGPSQHGVLRRLNDSRYALTVTLFWRQQMC